MSIVTPPQFLPPGGPLTGSMEGPIALATGERSPVEEMTAKVTQFMRLMGPVIDFLAENPDIALVAKPLFSSLAGKVKSEKIGKAVTGRLGIPNMPVPPMLVGPGPGPTLPGPGGLLP